MACYHIGDNLWKLDIYNQRMINYQLDQIQDPWGNLPPIPLEYPHILVQDCLPKVIPILPKHIGHRLGPLPDPVAFDQVPTCLQHVYPNRDRSMWCNLTRLRPDIRGSIKNS